MAAWIIALSVAASAGTCWGWWLRGWHQRHRPRVVVDGMWAPIRELKPDRIVVAKNFPHVPSSSSTFYVDEEKKRS